MAVTASHYVSLGLFMFGVKSYVASRDEKVPLTNLHRQCAEQAVFATLRTDKKCGVCAAPVAGEDVVKGYRTSDAAFVVVTEDELDNMTAEKSKTMEVRGFLPWGEIDSVLLGKANFLGPADPAAAKAFHLLRVTMQQQEMAAVVSYVGSGHDKLGVIRATDECLVLHDAFFGNELRDYASQNRVKTPIPTMVKKELDIAAELLASYRIEASDLAAYSDGYFNRLSELIQARVAGKPIAMRAPKPVEASVDLLSALQQSIAQRKGDVPAKAAPAKAPATASPKKAVKVAPAEKVAARKGRVA